MKTDTDNSTTGGSMESQAPYTDYIIRLNSQERLQHLLTFATFFILVITGFMLKIPETWILKLGETGKVIFEYRGLLHRISGAVMIIASLAHVWYIITNPDGRSFLRDMIPCFKDAKDMVQNLAYYLGMRKEPPEFDRFDYREKMEYWALVAGTIIISTTGVLLWTEEYWSTFVLDLSILIHGMEAILATLAIIVWHFYTVHYKPGKFPGSRVWIDGKMPLHELKEEHPLQFTKMVEEGLIDPRAAENVEHEHHSTGHTLTKAFTAFSMIICLVFAGWLVKLLYFPTQYSTANATGVMEKSFWLISSKDMAGHFHALDDNIKMKLGKPPVCITCHGTYPHSKSPDIRSFLNMHNYFMACETCHIRLDPNDPNHHFAWFDNKSDKQRVGKLRGEDGIFGARLVPVVVEPGGKAHRLDHQLDEKLTREYIAKVNTLSPEEQAKAKAVLHKNISKKPIQCTECHSRRPYIDFVAVGYSRARAESLYRTEVADMIDRYMKFYLPTMFDPDLIRQQKLRQLLKEDRSTQ
ncbi:formate dehydrogenase subunit gamma [Desulfolithobacter sp.]